MITGKLGLNELLFMTDPLDTWSAAARGSSARVFQGIIKNNNGIYKTIATKIMRPDWAGYALPLFLEEVEILDLMKDVPGVMRMLGMGFIDSQNPIQLPQDNTPNGVRDLSGSVILYHPTEYESFLNDLKQRWAVDSQNIASNGWVSSWVPYIAAQIRPHEDNLLVLCDPSYFGGKFMQVQKGLKIVSQVCDILKIAHERNIVYRDHKILHYYFSDTQSFTYLIDWNVAKIYKQGLSDGEIRHDLVQFGARAMHHIFTGRHLKDALPNGPTKPVDIDSAPEFYKVDWTYDDKRLPETVKILVSDVLEGRYDSAVTLKSDVCKIIDDLAEE